MGLGMKVADVKAILAETDFNKTVRQVLGRKVLSKSEAGKKGGETAGRGRAKAGNDRNQPIKRGNNPDYIVVRLGLVPRP